MLEPQIFSVVFCFKTINKIFRIIKYHIIGGFLTFIQ